jgi:membrane protease YdiL (CAAX protease family)
LNEVSKADNNRSLIAFFILAYLFSWSIGIPLALAHQGIIPQILPPWAHYLVAYGPLLSALIVTGLTGGASGLKDLGRRMVRWACPKWWLVALSPLIAGYIILLIQNLFRVDRLAFSELGSVNFLGQLGLLALPLWIFTFGFGEETGWRGFALPRLQEHRGAFSATMILAGFWALWHLPQFFYVYELSIAAIGWLIGLFAGAVVLTWLYNSSGESILMVALWHACFNYVSASTGETGILPFAISALVIFTAITIHQRTDPKTLVSI